MSGAESDQTSNQTSDRIMGLEEAALFAERRIDELHEQVLALSGRVEMLARRFERLERVVLEMRSKAESEPGAPDEPGDDGPDLID